MSIITNMVVNNILFQQIADQNRKAQEEHEKRMKEQRERHEKEARALR